MSKIRSCILFLIMSIAVFPSLLIAQNISPEKITIRSKRSPSEFDLMMRDETNIGPGIGLAFSGGGSRGLALIGVLKVLEKENINIKFIAGVSMGGIIGGLYSCGYSPEEIEKIALNVDWGELFSPSPQRSTLLITQKGQSEKSFLKVRFDGWKPVLPMAITSAQNLSIFLERLTARGGIRSCFSFDYLNPPFRTVCTDLTSGEKVVLSSGNLSEALRATVSVPVALTPVEIGGHLLVDGGLVDPIPVDLVKEKIGYPVIAVDVSSNLLPASKMIDVIDIADQTTTIMSMDKKQASLSNADLVIRPDLKGRISTDFSDIKSLIAAGEKSAQAAIPKLKQLLNENDMASKEVVEYHIRGWEIKGLKNMPRTFFTSTFADSSKISAKIIENNLDLAMTTGYLADAWAELIRNGNEYFIDYNLIDNPRIKKIAFSGCALFKDSSLIALISSRAGMVYNNLNTARDCRKIEKHYIDSGYSLVRVSRNFDTTECILAIKIDEGRLNRILVEGNKRTKGWAITRHVPFRKGEIFKQRQGEKAIEDIFSTDLFESAKLLAVPDSSGISLIIKVTEKPYAFIRAGGSFNMEYGSKAFIDLVEDNIFGAGQQFYLSTTAGEKRRAVSLNFQSDRIFKTLFTYQFTTNYNEFKRNYYVNHEYKGYFKQFSYGGELSLGRQIAKLGIISIFGSLYHYSWNEPNKIERQKFEKLSVGFRSIVDTRDQRDFPEVGKYHYLNLEFAGNAKNEKSGYTRFYTSIESYYELLPGLNFRPGFAVGVSSDFMPYFDEFSFGGIHNFPGRYEDEVLGDKLFLAGFDLRFRVINNLYLQGRLVSGNIWNKLGSIRLKDLKQSVGFGISLRTPLGPIETLYGRSNDGSDAFYVQAGYDW